MQTTTKTRRTVASAALKILNLENILMDPSYQRDVSDKGQARIIRNFNPEALGIPVVAEREDGTFWIVDGLQRITALKTMGKKTVRAEVFASNGPEHEALVFSQINRNRTQLKPVQIWYAGLAAGDKDYWEIKKVVEKHGLEVPRSQGGCTNLTPEKLSKRLNAIKTVIAIHSKGGAEAVDFVLRIATSCWGDDPQKVQDTVLLGLFTFWQRREKMVDDQRLIARLNTTTPGKMVYTSQLGIGSRSVNMADVIERIYKRRSPKSE